MSRRGHDYSYYPLLLGFIVTLILLLLLVFLLGLPLFPAWIIAFSLTTFAMFGFDKGMATAGKDRVPENVLHLFTILGGFPGQLIGRLLFHHKINISQHPLFNIVLIGSAILWAGLAYLFFFREPVAGYGLICPATHSHPYYCPLDRPHGQEGRQKSR